MSAVKSYGIRCDGCGYIEDTGYEGAAEARRSVRAEGWTHPRANAQTLMRIDVCPTCSKTGRAIGGTTNQKGDTE